MRQFSPEMAQKVAHILHRRLESVGDTARKSYSGFKAVADLLNRLNAEEAKKILRVIEDGQPELALKHSQSDVHLRRPGHRACRPPFARLSPAWTSGNWRWPCVGPTRSCARRSSSR
jgi:ribosomal protein L22